MSPDILAAFKDRVQRRLRDSTQEYHDELKAISHEMAARGLAISGAHVTRRMEAFARWMEAVTDQCFEEVTRLPGDQAIHREVHAPFLHLELLQFFSAAKGEVPVPGLQQNIDAEIERKATVVRNNLEADLRDFQAGLWRARSGQTAAPTTQNTVNIHGSTVGSVQQAGEYSSQSATVTFSAQTVRAALDEFVMALKTSDLPDDIRTAAMLEVDTIQPQLKKASPSTTIVQEGLRSLRNILEGAAAGLLSAKLSAVLIAAGMF